MNKSFVSLFLALSFFAGSVSCAYAQDGETLESLRVCADPFSLPTSSREEPGYENRIAELFAKRLGVPLEYTWFPQRIGFIRNTLRNNDTEDGRYLCDLVMGVVEGFEIAATTIPYYRSSWVMVFVEGRKLDQVHKLEDMLALDEETKASLRIGLFDKSPTAQWVFSNGFMENMRPYQMMTGDARAYPGQIVEKDLLSDEIDVTFVWGPIAGFFAKRAEENGQKVRIIPMPVGGPIKYDYQITMAVRFGEKQWKERVNQFIREDSEAINKILDEYHVPRLPLIVRENDDDDDD